MDSTFTTAAGKAGLVITRINRAAILAIVPSHSQAGNYHTVELDRATGKARCTCPGFTYHGHCYHQQCMERVAAPAKHRAQVDAYEREKWTAEDYADHAEVA